MSIIAPMRAVHASVVLRASVHDAQTRWCDTSRWMGWIDGFHELVEVGPGWPEVGSVVRWQTNPAGRGAVTETVATYEPLAALETDVEDDSIRGRQSVWFTPVDGDCEMTIRLAYEIKKRNLFTPLVDVLFVKRAMESSLRLTLSRFAAEFNDGGETS
jgi:hypothetical protein